MNNPYRLPFICLLIFCVPSFVSSAADEPLLPRPQNHVLDQAHVLLPEVVASLNAEFTKASRDDSIDIYLLTLPSVKAPAVNRAAKLEEIADKYTAAWIQGTGALILFDDESGLVSVAFSSQAIQVYSDYALSNQLRSPLQAAQASGLTREKLVRTSRAVLGVMGKLKQQTIIKTSEEHPTIKFIGAFLLLLALVLVIHFSLNRRPTSLSLEPEQRKTRRRKKRDKW
jgi:uncharacterized membrane protein YgcG